MYLNLSTGEVSRYESYSKLAVIGGINLRKDGIVDDFIDLVKLELPELHYTVDSETGDNTEFLLHVSREVGNIPEISIKHVNVYTRLILIDNTSVAVIINDSGYLQLRARSHYFLLSLLVGYEA